MLRSKCLLVSAAIMKMSRVKCIYYYINNINNNKKSLTTKHKFYAGDFLTPEALAKLRRGHFGLRVLKSVE